MRRLSLSPPAWPLRLAGSQQDSNVAAWQGGALLAETLASWENRSSRFSLCLPWGQGTQSVPGWSSLEWATENGKCPSEASVVWPDSSEPGPPTWATATPSAYQTLLLHPQPCSQVPSQPLAAAPICPPLCPSFTHLFTHSVSND